MEVTTAALWHMLKKDRFPGASLVVEGIKREKQPNFQ